MGRHLRHLTLSPPPAADKPARAAEAAVVAGGGRGWAGVGTALGALLEAVGQQVVELQAQAAADAAEMRMALLAVGCGRGGGRGGLMNGERSHGPQKRQKGPH
jgi:hypothetical protein